MAKKTAGPPMGLTRYGLRGRIVTMTSATNVIDNGVLYIDGNQIVAIVKMGEAVPAALKTVPIQDTKGTLYPGLIELHNHLSYNCLPLWRPPKKYTNRGQWSVTPEYRQLISGPMAVLGKTPGYVEAIVRYVEAKCLVAGVTTSQGVMLVSSPGIRTYYQGAVRNVENPLDLSLPKAEAHIPDVASKDAAHFLKQLRKSKTFLLHLAEGIDDTANRHFQSLKLGDRSWAITDALAGIHCTALTQADFDVLEQYGASMIWSPVSNLILYGATANVKAAKEKKIKIGIGSDWSPSGSKNLFQELKMARTYSSHNGQLFLDYEILAMATKVASEIVKWDTHLGTLEKGKYADLLVVKGASGDPYAHFFEAKQENIDLVIINGAARYGALSLMKKLAPGGEARMVSEQAKQFYFQETAANPIVGKLSLAEAETRLRHGLANLNTIAKEQPPLKATTARFISKPANKPGSTVGPWVLVLDHDEAEGEAIRPHLPGDGQRPKSISQEKLAHTEAASLPIITLDPLFPDDGYFKALNAEPNLPEYMKTSTA